MKIGRVFSARIKQDNVYERALLPERAVKNGRGGCLEGHFLQETA